MILAMYFWLNIININDGFVVYRKHKESELNISYSHSLKPFKKVMPCQCTWFPKHCFAAYLDVSFEESSILGDLMSVMCSKQFTVCFDPD